MRRLYVVRWEYERRNGVMSVWAVDDAGAGAAARTRLLGDTTKRFRADRLMICQITATRWMELGEGIWGRAIHVSGG